MLIGIVAETDPRETRVAASPETVKKFIALGAEVAVQSGAGVNAGFTDAEYQAAGAQLTTPPAPRRRRRAQSAATHRRRDRRIEIRRTGDRDHGSLRPPRRNRSARESWRRRLRDGADASHHPRPGHGRAVAQANLAGYRAVIDASAEYGRALPMMMTPAGTVPAARAFIMGVGVAGLAGDRNGAPARRDRNRDRRPPGYKRTGRIARREIRRRRGRRVQTGGDGRRLRQGDVRRLQGQAGRARRLPYRQAGYRHHDGAYSGPRRRRGWSARRW